MMVNNWADMKYDRKTKYNSDDETEKNYMAGSRFHVYDIWIFQTGRVTSKLPSPSSHLLSLQIKDAEGYVNIK